MVKYWQINVALVPGSCFSKNGLCIKFAHIGVKSILLRIAVRKSKFAHREECPYANIPSVTTDLLFHIIETDTFKSTRRRSLIMKYKVAVYSHNLYAGDIIWGFNAAGCEVKNIRPNSPDHFDNLMGEMNPDLLVLSSSMDFFQRSMLRYIGSRNSPNYKCVCWDTEGIGQYIVQMTSFEALKPDLVFSICPEMLEKLKSKNILVRSLILPIIPQFIIPKQLRRMKIIISVWSATPGGGMQMLIQIIFDTAKRCRFY